jgi:hypothetical protein
MRCGSILFCGACWLNGALGGLCGIIFRRGVSWGGGGDDA